MGGPAQAATETSACHFCTTWSPGLGVDHFDFWPRRLHLFLVRHDMSPSCCLSTTHPKAQQYFPMDLLRMIAFTDPARFRQIYVFYILPTIAASITLKQQTETCPSLWFGLRIKKRLCLSNNMFLSSSSLNPAQILSTVLPTLTLVPKAIF
jgi:hypothetical protein